MFWKYGKGKRKVHLNFCHKSYFDTHNGRISFYWHITETSSTKIGKSCNIQLSADFHFVNLDPVVTFQTKHLNVYIWMKETKLYVARISNFYAHSDGGVTLCTFLESNNW